MPSAADFQPRTKFGDVEFPGTVHRVSLTYRHHVHEYPHSPGGAPEKFGRALYRVVIVAEFHATLPRYPGLYPDGMNQVRSYAEQGATLPLTHPSTGTFPAFIIDWQQSKDAKIRSGERVEITFLEDQSATYALAALTSSNFSSAMSQTAGQMASELAAVQQDLAAGPLQLNQNDLEIFDSLQSAVNSLLALRDTAQLYGNRYSAAVQQVINLCQQVDGLQSCQDARAWPLIDVQRDLWAQAISVQNDILAKQAQLQTWIVPRPMSVAEIAMSLYNDASRSSDIVTLNANVIDDPTRVKAGTSIRYYPNPPNAQASAA